MLDLNAIDIEEIATALADQTDYEHRWLIDPSTGEIAFWTTDTGIDGENPVELDELDLASSTPFLRTSGTRTWPTWQKAPATAPRAGPGTARCRVRARSGVSRTSSKSDILT